MFQRSDSIDRHLQADKLPQLRRRSEENGDLQRRQPNFSPVSQGYRMPTKLLLLHGRSDHKLRVEDSSAPDDRLPHNVVNRRRVKTLAGSGDCQNALIQEIISQKLSHAKAVRPKKSEPVLGDKRLIQSGSKAPTCRDKSFSLIESTQASMCDQNSMWVRFHLKMPSAHCDRNFQEDTKRLNAHVAKGAELIKQFYTNRIQLEKLLVSPLRYQPRQF